MTTFNTRVTFDHVRNTAAGYAAANPVLGYGVIGLETDTGRAKIGDGATAWNSLGYFTGQIAWSGITEKPATFAPAAHTHDDRYYTESEVDTLLAGKQAAGSYALTTDSRLSDARQPLAHQHTASQISDFAAAVVAAAPPTTNASLLTSGTLDAARLPGSVVLTTDSRLTDARQPLSHTHDDRYYTESEVDTLLAGKQATGSYVLTTDSRLSDARQPLAHQHTASQISDFTSAVIAAAPPTVDASLLTQGTLPDARLSANIARTSDVSSAVAAVVNAAPASLDTLKELADALGNDASFAATVTNSLAGKASLVHTHTVSAITDAGTAATRNVPATGNAGASEVVLGNDTRLSDARTPLTHTHSAAQITNFAVAAAAVAPVQSVAGRTGAVTLAVADVSGAVASSDSRLSDARAPTAHKSTHATGGTDALTPADIGAAAQSHTHAVTDLTAGGTPSASTFLRGDGTWAAAGSTNAGDLVAGTLSDDRLSAKARAAINVYLWSSFR